MEGIDYKNFDFVVGKSKTNSDKKTTGLKIGFQFLNFILKS